MARRIPKDEQKYLAADGKIYINPGETAAWQAGRVHSVEDMSGRVGISSWGSYRARTASARETAVAVIDEVLLHE